MYYGVVFFQIIPWYDGIVVILISWRINAVGAWVWQPYPHHVTIVLKSWIPILLEPSGPVQACTGIVNFLLLLII